MSSELVPLQRLERGYLGVLRVRAALGWALFAAILTGAALVGSRRLDTDLVFAVPGLVGLVGLWAVLIVQPARWRRWGYAFTERELHVARGWLTRLHTVVPVARVQHIDVSQGPIERAFGVATLRLHTAGSLNSLVVLPGLASAQAEAIRDAIRARIGAVTR